MPTTTHKGLSYATLDDETLPAPTRPPPWMPTLLASPSRRPLTVSHALAQAKAAELVRKGTKKDVQDAVETVPEGDWERFARREKCMLFPPGPRKTSWDIMMLVLILYSCVSVPYRIGMGVDAEGGMWIFEVVVTCFFMTDVGLTFCTAYLDGDQFIVSRPMIADNYLKGWFIIDLSSSFPLEIIEVVMAHINPSTETESTSALRMLRALRLVRLFRLLRLLKIQKYVSMLEEKIDVNLQVPHKCMHTRKCGAVT